MSVSRRHLLGGGWLLRRASFTEWGLSGGHCRFVIVRQVSPGRICGVPVTGRVVLRLLLREARFPLGLLGWLGAWLVLARFCG